MKLLKHIMGQENKNMDFYKKRAHNEVSPLFFVNNYEHRSLFIL